MFREKRLIRQLNAGETQVFRTLYELYKDDCMTLAKALLFDRDQAEDVVQDVFARLIQLRGTLSIKRNLRGYLLSATANMARNKNRSQTLAAGVHPPEQRSNNEPDQILTQAERQDRLSEAMQQLPYEQREVILLRHYGNLRFKTIGQAQGVSTNTIQGRYRYGIKKLRSLLEDAS